MHGNKIESRKYQKYKIIIAYHSESGSTRTISEILRDRLSNYYKVDMVIEEKTKNFSIILFDGFIDRGNNK